MSAALLQRKQAIPAIALAGQVFHPPLPLFELLDQLSALPREVGPGPQPHKIWYRDYAPGQ